MDQDLIDIKEVVAFIARKENGKVEINIAEIKQILEVTMEKLGEFNTEQILEFVNRYRRRGSRDKQ